MKHGLDCGRGKKTDDRHVRLNRSGLTYGSVASPMATRARPKPRGSFYGERGPCSLRDEYPANSLGAPGDFELLPPTRQLRDRLRAIVASQNSKAAKRRSARSGALLAISSLLGVAIVGCSEVARTSSKDHKSENPYSADDRAGKDRP